jgi:hypothetical protein
VAWWEPRDKKWEPTSSMGQENKQEKKDFLLFSAG